MKESLFYVIIVSLILVIILFVPLPRWQKEKEKKDNRIFLEIKIDQDGAKIQLKKAEFELLIDKNNIIEELTP